MEESVQLLREYKGKGDRRVEKMNKNNRVVRNGITYTLEKGGK